MVCDVNCYMPDTNTYIGNISNINNNNIIFENNKVIFADNIKNFEWELETRYEITVKSFFNDRHIINIKKLER